MTTWEEFLMQVGDYAVIASAIITLIGVIFTLFKNNSLSKEAVDRTSVAEGALSKEHKDISSDVKGLSSEHKEITANQAIILERTAESKDAARRMIETLSGIDRRMIQAEADRSKQFMSLDAQQHQLVASASDIGKFADAFLKLSLEKSELEKQLQGLQIKDSEIQKENAILRKENESLRRELAQSQSRDEEELEP